MESLDADFEDGSTPLKKKRSSSPKAATQHQAGDGNGRRKLRTGKHKHTEKGKENQRPGKVKKSREKRTDKKLTGTILKISACPQADCARASLTQTSATSLPTSVVCPVPLQVSQSPPSKLVSCNLVL